MLRAACCALLVLAATGLVPEPAGAAARPCPAFSPGQERGTVDDPGLAELSGLAASRANPGVLWAHADSGAGAEIHALTETGGHLATYVLQGVTATDWEDIAAGPGPEDDTTYVYVGDIGDNNSVRPDVTVYRVPEPVVAPSPVPEPIELTGAVALTVTYPDGAHDAETLLSDPLTGDLFVVTKTLFSGPSDVYRWPAPQQPDAVLEHVATISVPSSFPGSAVTAGDISPQGDEILLRTYSTVFAWRRAAGQSVAAALGGTACPLPLESETQGEAVAYRLDGDAYFTSSEWSSAGPRPLYEYLARRRPDGLIRRGAGTPVGNDVYGLRGDEQSRRATLGHRGRVTFTALVQNDGDRNDDIRLRGDPGSQRFRVRYLRSGNPITTRVINGAYRVADIAPGRSVPIQIEVTALPGAPVGATRTFSLTLTSQASPTVRDRVKAVVERG